MNRLFLAAAACLLAAPTFAAQSVPLGHFTAVGLRGGGHVVLKYGKTQSITLLKGSMQYTSFRIEHGGSLEIDACNSNCPNHYDLEIEIVSPDIHGVAVEGGGSIEAAGNFPAQGRLDAAVSGGGGIDVRAISASSVSAAVNGGGRIKVAATGSLTAAVNGGGHIAYWGTPQVSQAVSGGGHIDRATN
jgi:hypothetical protein